MFVSVDGKAKEVKEVFAGGTDGLAHKIDEIYGSVDGVAKLIYSGAEREPNAFDKLTWAEIKALADAGLLLEHFKKGDLVDIKFKEPIERNSTYGHVIQDGITMQVVEVTEYGMRLVSYTALPLAYTWSIDNEVYKAEIKGETWDIYPRVWEPHYYWGMCESLYNCCKAIDNRLPDDMREVLHDYSPCNVWEYYVDDEGKTRFRKGFDDCRVHQVTTCGYEYHREFVEERDRNEYILDFSHYPTSEQKYKKYFPESLRKISWYDTASCGVTWRYYQYANNGGGYWMYRFIWNDPEISWNWDWENYDNWNKLDSIQDPPYGTTFTVGSAFVPEVMIGTMPNQVLDFDGTDQTKFW
jgi:hypothetical protein